MRTPKRADTITNSTASIGRMERVIIFAASRPLALTM
jgi:hypothetical protein